MTSEQRHREAHEGRLVVMVEPSKQAERLFQVTAREGPATYYPGCGSRSRPLRVHRAASGAIIAGYEWAWIGRRTTHEITT